MAEKNKNALNKAVSEVIETANSRLVDQFDSKILDSMLATAGVMVIKPENPNKNNSAKHNVILGTVECPPQEALYDLLSIKNQDILIDFVDSITQSQNKENMLKNVPDGAVVEEFFPADITSVTTQCIKNYISLDSRNPKKIASR